jgi:hypothetical protein
MPFFYDEDPSLFNPLYGESPTEENYSDFVEYEDRKTLEEENIEAELEEQVSKIIQRWWRNLKS